MLQLRVHLIPQTAFWWPGEHRGLCLGEDVMYIVHKTWMSYDVHLIRKYTLNHFAWCS
jgi:hypothetical protein